MSATIYKTCEPLRSSDYRALENRWITREYAEAAGLFRVDNQSGAALVGRNGKQNYAGVVIPYRWPGSHNPREFLLRRDEPDYERRRDGSLRQVQKYVAPPRRKSLLYFAPGSISDWLTDVDIPVIFVEGPFKAIALERYFRERGETVLVIALSGVWNWRGVIEQTLDANGKRIDVKGPIPDLDRIEWHGRAVTILFDRNVHDNESVRAASTMFARELRGRVSTVSFVDLPPDFQGNGVDDFLAERGPDALSKLLNVAESAPATASAPAVTPEDFYALMTLHKYIFAPNGEIWPAASVNARIPPIPTGKSTRNGHEEEFESAASWLDRYRAVEQVTWAPGEPVVIRDRLIDQGGWIHRVGCSCFNLYRPPQITLGDPRKAERWLAHASRLYPADTAHIVSWLAYRVQHPAEKINHALVLGGGQGIGKDSLLSPVRHTVGLWNFVDISPHHLLGRFNGFVKSIILRVSEARDLGESHRYAFYEHMKIFTASPPEVLRVDEKNLREYSIPNLCGVILTTNHVDGLYLPSDDRRHFVAWSDLTKEDFDPDYWRELHCWFDAEGNQHVSAYLNAYDVSSFDPNAPPPQTEAWRRIVDSNRAPEDAELADAIDALGKRGSDGSIERPEVLTLEDIADLAPDDFRDWLLDRRNRRCIPHRLETAGYVVVRNDAAKDGQWVVQRKRQNIYALREFPLRDRIAKAADFVRQRSKERNR